LMLLTCWSIEASSFLMSSFLRNVHKSLSAVARMIFAALRCPKVLSYFLILSKSSSSGIRQLRTSSVMRPRTWERPALSSSWWTWRKILSSDSSPRMSSWYSDLAPPINRKQLTMSQTSLPTAMKSPTANPKDMVADMGSRSNSDDEVEVCASQGLFGERPTQRPGSAVLLAPPPLDSALEIQGCLLCK
jgi:hypothetical protein